MAETNSNISFVISNLDYDIQNGDLKIYDNGKYSFTGVSTFKDLLSNVPEDITFCFYSNQKNYYFDNEEEWLELDDEGNEILVKHKYALISYSNFLISKSYPLLINFLDGKALTKKVILNIYDSLFNIEFKIDKIEIDRSAEGAFYRQLPFGYQLINYITITTDGIKMPFNQKQLHFYIERYLAGTSIYRGTAISISNDTFDECTWANNASDDIYVLYGDKIYGKMNIKIITSNPNKIYIKAVKAIHTIKVNKNETINLKKVLTFYPEDANVSYLDTLTLLSNNSNIAVITKNNISVFNNWNDAFNLYEIKANNIGKTQLYYTWRSIISSTGGGGDFYFWCIDGEEQQETEHTPISENDKTSQENSIVIDENDITVIEKETEEGYTDKIKIIKTINIEVTEGENYNPETEHYIYINTYNKTDISGLSCRIKYLNNENEISEYTHFHNNKFDTIEKSKVIKCYPGDNFQFSLIDISIDDINYFKIFFTVDDGLNLNIT